MKDSSEYILLDCMKALSLYCIDMCDVMPMIAFLLLGFPGYIILRISLHVFFNPTTLSEVQV